MRRSEREVRGKKEIERILEKCRVLRIGLWDGKEIYLVPLNFAYEFQGENLILYIHSAKDGRKINVIRNHPNIGFETDWDGGVKESENACGTSYRYESIIGTGRAEIIENPEEKQNGLAKLMQRYTGRKDTFFGAMAANVAVIKITAQTLAAKRNE